MSTFSTINADLHCHSVVSDGTLTPEELAERAHANGVRLWALTDHDELGGQQRARAAAADLKMEYLAGVEISVTWMGQTIHIVGLGINEQHAGILEGLKQTREGRGDRAKLMAEQLLKAGIPGAYEGALHYAGNHDLISRTHFARFLVEQGVCRDTEQVFKNYLVENKPGYVPHRWASLADAIAWIKAAGGVAVIAHPGRYKLNAMQRDELFKFFKEHGGLGIEVITGSHTPDQYQEYGKIAQQYGFLASRGSDFHDPSESHTDLGALPLLPHHLTPVWSVFH
ncbi:3',5'-nucleoside bisphosphate phosphatase [Polynucleobacter sp. AP-Latsch-80-C2]|jgi:predicted metal-dependent phosphoesterase TrpH|uniref:3',5'-nucleoside bisphosphate phosphatase n=1 Tax=Polynucleobacter sp. AP-Latsch-80-C2 TaxID=2576931 RepID=UPI001C0BED6B|nr:3',5'-nucleoside bisphosphate phosphatase [Polynucleobacter sp. AP-Latsch-80-C2]MBU3622469.1 PHP domain-containing protein [Polynucleobacter sp. AP-Latsch-80-C2]